MGRGAAIGGRRFDEEVRHAKRHGIKGQPPRVTTGAAGRFRLPMHHRQRARSTARRGDGRHAAPGSPTSVADGPPDAHTGPIRLVAAKPGYYIAGTDWQNDGRALIRIERQA
jgi:hypothetical protein